MGTNLRALEMRPAVQEKRLSVPVVWKKEHPKFVNGRGQKEEQKSEIHRSSQSVVSKLLGTESGILGTDLLYKHTAGKKKEIN